MRNLLTILILSLSVSVAYGAKKPKNKVQPIPFSAKSFAVADSNGGIIKSQDSDSIRPIASITKLMVSLLVVEQDLQEQLNIPKKRTVQSSIPFNVTSLSREELLTLSLVKSDNFASQILCENIPNCIERMNEKSRSLGMENTHFVEPTGLSSDNVSTADDLVKLMVEASRHDVISSISSRPVAEIVSTKKPIKVRNTNPLTTKMNVTLSKTGFTNPAGGCLVMIIGNGLEQTIYILLGSRNTKTRIIDMERLVKQP